MSTCTSDARAALGRRLIEQRVRFAAIVLERCGAVRARVAADRSLPGLRARCTPSGRRAPMPSSRGHAWRATRTPPSVVQHLLARLRRRSRSGRTARPRFLAAARLPRDREDDRRRRLPAWRCAPHRTSAAPPHGVIEGVLAMLSARDEATCAHSHATGAWCRRMCEAMELPAAQTDIIVKAGMLHDIGKIATPDAILFKPGPLTSDEWTIMQQHAEFGADILAALPALAPYAPIVRAHHERWDGSGYPYGLKGEADPLRSTRRRRRRRLPRDDQRPPVPSRDRAARSDRDPA